MTVAAVDGDSVVAFHPLAFRADGSEVVLGRTGSDVFVAVPAIGAEAIASLATGASVGEVEERIEAATGERVDVADLVSVLIRLGIVATVDGHVLPTPPPARVTLPRLKPGHVSWMLHRHVHGLAEIALALLVAAAIGFAVSDRAPLPDASSLLWTENGSLVLAAQVAIGWSLILVHEAAHLITARAAGVPGYMEFGTRLQFLVAQTNVTGVWAAPLRHRLAVYTAGMRADLAIGALAFLASTWLEPGSLSQRLALVVTVLAFTGLTLQLLIFMRTDVYFVVQDLTRSRNLYGDSAAYARHLATRVASAFRMRNLREAGPLAAMDQRERRIVKGYTALLVAGTAVCLLYAAAVLVPFAFGLVRGAVTAIASGGPGAVLDGFVVLTVQGALLTVWSRAWWARHGHRLRGRRRVTAPSPQ